MNHFDQERHRALRIIGHIKAMCAKYDQLLGNVGHIRHSGYGIPYWVDALGRAYDDLMRSYQEACRNAELPPPGQQQ